MLALTGTTVLSFLTATGITSPTGTLLAFLTGLPDFSTLFPSGLDIRVSSWARPQPGGATGALGPRVVIEAGIGLW